MATRKERGLSERIYLLEANLINTKEWILLVKGSSARTYNITFSEEETKCECMDFSIRRKVCKHLHFIFGRIIKDKEISKKIKIVDDITSNFNDISSLLETILCDHVQNKEKDEDISYDNKDTCSICFEEFGNESIRQCKKICNNIFHTECINLWLSKNNSCPLCRSSWDNSQNDNPLEEFVGLSLR